METVLCVNYLNMEAKEHTDAAFQMAVLVHEHRFDMTSNLKLKKISVECQLWCGSKEKQHIRG